MFSNLESLITEIADATEKAYRGLLQWPVPKLVREHHTLMEYNAKARNFLLRSDKGSVKWLNEVIFFLFYEFVFEGNDAPGWQKARIFNRCLEDARIRYQGAQQAQVTELALKSFSPFLRLHKEQKIWRALREGLAVSCLIVTALPGEFRAMIRRLSGIIKINAFKLDEETPSPDGMYGIMKAFDPNFDSESPRQFWLLVEGVVSVSNESKVAIILLPQYGGQKSHKFVNLAARVVVDFREILVVGVAGRLDKSAFNLGDVVVSNKIFDATLLKEVPQSRGRKEYVNKERPWFWHTPEYVPEASDVLPMLRESTPCSKGRTVGLTKVAVTDVVSGSSLSKSADFRAILNRNFPSCGAIEMEALGCCEAFSGSIPVRVIKGLCDNSDFTKSKEWQPYCADAAAAVAAMYIDRVFGESNEIVQATERVAEGGSRVSN